VGRRRSSARALAAVVGFVVGSPDRLGVRRTWPVEGCRSCRMDGRMSVVAVGTLTLPAGIRSRGGL